MQRFLKDWRSWKPIEQVIAVAFVAWTLVGMPLAMALNVH